MKAEKNGKTDNTFYRLACGRQNVPNGGGCMRMYTLNTEQIDTMHELAHKQNAMLCHTMLCYAIPCQRQCKAVYIRTLNSAFLSPVF